MILREYQKRLVDDSLAALEKHGNTLIACPTGGGKTLVLSSLAGRKLRTDSEKVCIIQHRTELVSQNSTKFRKVNPDLSATVVNADRKDWDGRAVFAMAQTLCRENNLDVMPPLDGIIIDEAHHAVAGGYLSIVERAKAKNPNMWLFGVTATPNRGDGKGLREVFNNLASQVEIKDLIRQGYLVPPRTFVIDLGNREELKGVKKRAGDFDMEQVEALMNTSVINSTVVEKWREYAEGRKTIVFCSTVRHAENVCEAFIRGGVDALIITGEMADAERKEVLRSYEHGSTEVLINVAVLTEGYDYTPTSCIVLLRPCSYKSTMLQMIGRGLRIVDAEEFPGVIKEDCVILDFGASCLTHGTLEDTINLDGLPKGEGDAPEKQCGNCGAFIPIAVMECPFCGYIFESKKETKTLEKIILTEYDMLARSPFRWCDIFNDDRALMASGFSSWAGVFGNNAGDTWLAIGGLSQSRKKPKLLFIGNRLMAIAKADDWMCENETEDAAKKTASWIKHPASGPQRDILNRSIYKFTDRGKAVATSYGLTKYHASCLISYVFNKHHIVDIANRSKEVMGKAA